MKEISSKVDSNEFELPQTLFSRDIETRVIQMIILQALSKVKGVSLIEGKLIDFVLRRDIERVKGIYVEQDEKNHLVTVKVEVKIDYGISIPLKAEEIQVKIVEEISSLTGLHVSSVHVVIKGLNTPKLEESLNDPSLLISSLTALEQELDDEDSQD